MCGPLSLDDSISIEESHQLIDEAILRHQASISALKSQKNSLISICRLPPEILCQIFWELKKDVQLNNRNQLPAGINWIEVTHVCSRWRHVAINSPSLWVDPPLGNRRWVQEMLERSKDAGLVIEVNCWNESIETITPGFKLALKHSSRIKHLSIEHIYESAWYDLQMTFPKSAPQLEYFRLTGDSRRWFIDTTNYHPVISEKVFCETERLRHLVLSACNPNWNSHPSFLRSLTSLSLHDLALDCRPSGEQFMDALREMPDLQILDIKDGLPVKQTWVTDQIHLASLQVLSIHSTYIEVETFFQCVTFPPTAKVTVECNVEPSSTANFTGVITNVSRSYSKPLSDMAFHTLIYLPSSFALYGPRFKLFRNAVVDEQIIRYKSIAGDLELAFGFSEAPEAQLVTKLLENLFSGPLPLQDIAMHTDLMWVGKCRELCQAAKNIAETLGILPQVRSVLAGRYTSTLLLMTLQLQFRSQIKETGLTDPVKDLPFPNLSSIYLQGSKFGNGHFVGSHMQYLDFASIISVESLKDCLIQRSKSGAKIKNLTLKSCRKLGKREAEYLSQFVDVFEWDQSEVYSDSESDDYEEEDDEEEEIYSEDYDDDVQDDLFD